MPLTEVYQQSLLGDVWSLITLPFRIVWNIVRWVFSLVLSILLIPFRVVQWLYYCIKRLVPVIYAENIYHSVKGLLCAFKILFFVLTGLLIVLLPLYVLFLLGGYSILENFDLIHALKLMATAVFTTEAAIIGLSIVGFLVLSVLAFLFVTGASLLELMGVPIKLINMLTSSRLFLLLTFMVAVMVLVILYLLLIGKIPMPSLFL